MAGLDLQAEWLEADGRGGFASGTVSGLRTRRYHALLLAATHPPAGRTVLVNGIEAWAEGDGGTVPLSSQRYAPDIVHGDARPLIASFAAAPWPTWNLRLPDGTQLCHEVLVGRRSGATLLRWRRMAGQGACRLHVRPLLSGRDYHALHHENPAFQFASAVQQGPADATVTWQPYTALPRVTANANAAFAAAPDWYRRFLYTVERDRGMDDTEDLATPGIFTWDLAAGPAVLTLRAGEGPGVPALEDAARIEADERDRRCGAPPRGSVSSYVVGRGEGRTIVAGYPWFTDWGRDTFIALRGLLLATGQAAEAEQILLAWSGLVNEGMLPSRFPDDAGPPEYNSVDASLWFAVAVHDLLRAAPGTPSRAALQKAVGLILDGYAGGTRFGIVADAGDGLLRAGQPGQQLTWMDAKLGDWVVTPRIGKPVEVQALWVNALRIGAAWQPKWGAFAERAQASFLRRFPDPDSGGLADVVDADGVPGRIDRRIRPNQILAVGGLPFPLLSGPAARRVVDLVEAQLLTPMGLRTLAPDDPDYVGRYAGGPAQRDGAYHQGTVWPWLTGPFVEAWLRVHGDDPATRAEAATRFLAPLRAHLDTAGLGHVSEVADGDAPHTPGGCPFQAWSLGELLRAEALVTS